MAAALTADRTLLLERLTEYGRNGTSSLLEDIGKRLQSVAKPCRIPLEIGSSVLYQCIRVFENNSISDPKRAAWHILAFMCDRQSNVFASELLSVVDTTDILKFVPKSVVSLSTGDSMESSGCLQFVACFGMSTERRQATVGETEGLIESVLHAIDKHFMPACEILKGRLLRTLIILVARSSTAVSERFVRNSGFRIVNHVFYCIYQFALILKSKGATTFSSDESGVLHGGLSALCAMFSSCVEIDPRTTDLPRTMYAYDPAGLIQTTSALHEFFTFSDDPQFIQATIVLIDQYLFYVEELHPESLEFVLLYRGKKRTPITYVGQPMLIHTVLLTRHPQFQHFAETVQDSVRTYSNKFPTVDEMMRELLSKTPAVVSASGPVPNVCALPGCLANSTGVSRMMRCGRCREVSYCGEEHQREHWKVHKRVCVPKK